MKRKLQVWWGAQNSIINGKIYSPSPCQQLRQAEKKKKTEPGTPQPSARSPDAQHTHVVLPAGKLCTDVLLQVSLAYYVGDLTRSKGGDKVLSCSSPFYAYCCRRLKLTLFFFCLGIFQVSPPPTETCQTFSVARACFCIAGLLDTCRRLFVFGRKLYHLTVM